VILSGPSPKRPVAVEACAALSLFTILAESLQKCVIKELGVSNSSLPGGLG
jgi:hypothetical protein